MKITNNLEVTHKGVILKINLFQKTYYARLSHRVVRKFDKIVLKYLSTLLSLDSDFASYYENALLHFLETRDIRVLLNVEMFTKSQEVVERWMHENGVYRWNFPQTGVLDREAQLALIRASLLMKIYSLLLHTNISDELELKHFYKILLDELDRRGVLKFLFDYVKLKLSTKINSSFWGWFTSSRFQDLYYHAVTLYTTLLTTILTQLEPNENPLAYIKSVTDRSVYYLVTDVYSREVRYFEQKQPQFTYTVSLIEKQVLLSMIERLTFFVSDKVNWGTVLGRHNHPTYLYITVPFLVRALQTTSYTHFLNIPPLQQMQCSFYVGEVLTSFADLQAITQLLKSFCSGTPIQQRTRKVLLNESFHLIGSTYDNILVKHKSLDFIAHTLSQFTYWKINESGGLVKVTPQAIAEGVHLFYKKLFTDEFDPLFHKLRVLSFDPTLL